MFRVEEEDNFAKLPMARGLGMGSANDMQSAQDVAIISQQALGRGFDVTSDFRLKFCKLPVLQLNDRQLRNISVPGNLTIPNVSRDIKCDKGERMRFTSDVIEFQKMSEFFNKNASIEGKVPLGFFNTMYNFSGSWQIDASETKNLALDGCFITLYNLRLTGSPLSIREEVKQDVPSTWEPAGLARFIEKYGTHIIMSVNVGGQDVLYLKEYHSSTMSAIATKQYLKKIGDQYFVDGNSEDFTTKGKEKMEKINGPCKGSRSSSYANIAEIPGSEIHFNNKDLTIISRKRGGNIFANSHCKWQDTVHIAPDVISMAFIPITSLLSGVTGLGFLNHAINLYIRYKPPVNDIQCFLDFQVPRQWAPVYNELPLGLPRKQVKSPSLRFSLMGQKLYINTIQVSVGRKPVTGLRLYLEGIKSNRLAIHLQHLSNLPRGLQLYWNENQPHEQPKWRDFENGDTKWFEPIKWRSFSHVCTACIKYNPKWLGDKGGVFVVTGAQLEVRDYRFKRILHLRLLFTRVPGCAIQKSCWDYPPAISQKSGFLSSLSTTFTSQSIKKQKKKAPIVVDSAVYPGGFPTPVQIPKLLKFVDTKESTKGPQDVPGHWLVTAAQLELDRGKICLRVKYSLLAYDVDFSQDGSTNIDDMWQGKEMSTTFCS